MTPGVTWQSNPPDKLLKVRSCYIEYLTTYLGDYEDYHCRACGNCRASNFPHIRPSDGMLKATTHFLEEEFLPRITHCPLSKKLQGAPGFHHREELPCALAHVL